jgi:dGTPase
MTGRFLVRREHLEADEERRLAPYATLSSAATWRHGSERDSDLRLAYQRDRDRIIHSRAFRRPKHKTQVFVPHLADHRRTRLTHTLEVAQLGRSIARALALNEDLVEAIAYGHDLGHTAFGHTGETVINQILTGSSSELQLPDQVTAQAGAFKHNYQSLRVVDLLERRYSHPGLNLSDQVREGILKHTSWQPSFPFPLIDAAQLRLDQPCHLEGQAVAVADEIAQQTHDLEDGLRVGSVRLEAVEQLEIARVVSAGLISPDTGSLPRWRRQSLLIRGMISFFTNDVVTTAATALEQICHQHGLADRDSCRDRRDLLMPATVWLSGAADAMFDELKTFIYRYIINHPQVNRQDWRARKVISGLFRAFWQNPLNLPTYVLLRAKEELGFTFLRDLPLGSVAAEVASRYHSSPGFARLVADHIAGMSDRFALEDYHSLEHPSPDQRFTGDLE